MKLFQRDKNYNPALTLELIQEISAQTSKQDEEDYGTEIFFKFKAPYPYNSQSVDLARKTAARLGYSFNKGSHMNYWKSGECTVSIDITLHKIWWQDDDDDLPF